VHSGTDGGYPWALMSFCTQCGKQVEAGTVCAACGKCVAPDAMELMAAELRRQHTQMWYIVVAMGLVAAATVGLLAGWLLHGQRRDNGPASAPVAQPQSPPSQKPAHNSPEQPESPGSPSSQPGQLAPAPMPKENSSGGKTPSNSIDVQAIQNAVSGMAQRGGQKGSSSQQSVTGSAARSASDRYPGSQPVDIKDAAIPDVGMPVSNQVYSTSDSLATVMAYYKQLYPDAQVMEISGQNIIAVDRPGETKVIAIGTSGSDTRIAIVQPGN
jgi:hypothetical protein